tara:strand:- start:1034 stop:1609 length:576 start_codon:yes stop_codon:yes gene_type:complete
VNIISLNLKKILPNLLIPLIFIALSSCGTGGDARKNPPEPELRVKRNLEEGRGFTIDNVLKNRKKRGGDFEFASSNELWRASLDTIDFMPLSSVNYSGGIIITDWYSDDSNIDESVKISIRFLTNEVRADALNIKVFYKKCNQVMNCKISQKKGTLVTELKRKILNKAATYKKEKKDKNFKEYTGSFGKQD